MEQNLNVVRISAKYEISEDKINSCTRAFGQDFVKNDINKSLAVEIANEIMKMYANKIKIVQNVENRSVTYYCDVLVYNPKESDNK